MAAHAESQGLGGHGMAGPWRPRHGYAPAAGMSKTRHLPGRPLGQAAPGTGSPFRLQSSSPQCLREPWGLPAQRLPLLRGQVGSPSGICTPKDLRPKKAL